jgi:hypothetical protein
MVSEIAWWVNEDKCVAAVYHVTQEAVGGLYADLSTV